MNFDLLISKALSSGAHKATVIKTENIVLSRTFRDICASNGCGIYGKCWMCPPDIGEIDELMEKVRSFEYGLLYQTVYQIEDSFDIEGMSLSSVLHAKVCQEVEENLKETLGAHLHLGCGGCHLCKRCAKLDGLPCRMPEKAIPPMEGYGIDVGATTRPTELKYINGENTVTFFGIVLF